MPIHLQVKNLPHGKSTQISVRDALFVTVPYQLHRFVRKHTKWQDMPQSSAAASRFGKSPDGAARSTYGENLSGFAAQQIFHHKAHTVHLLKNQYHENMEVKVDEIQSEK